MTFVQNTQGFAGFFRGFKGSDVFPILAALDYGTGR
jgi:hypothetical protein